MLPGTGWLLRVRATGGNAVLLIGGHALSLALSRVLKSRGVHARIIDSNADHVAACARHGIDVLVGDATDTRWLDDAGAPHDTGWVIAWTGNDTVDRVAARWARERLGDDHAILWSNKPHNSDLQPADISGNVDLSTIIADIESGSIVIADHDKPDKFKRVLLWINQDDVQFAVGNRPLPKPSDKIRFIGIAENTQEESSAKSLS